MRYWELQVAYGEKVDAFTLSDDTLSFAVTVLRLILTRGLTPQQITDAAPETVAALNIQQDEAGDLVGAVGGLTVRARLVDASAEIKQ